MIHIGATAKIHVQYNTYQQVTNPKRIELLFLPRIIYISRRYIRDLLAIALYPGTESGPMTGNDLLICAASFCISLFYSIFAY